MDCCLGSLTKWNYRMGSPVAWILGSGLLGDPEGGGMLSSRRGCN